MFCDDIICADKELHHFEFTALSINFYKSPFSRIEKYFINPLVVKVVLDSGKWILYGLCVNNEYRVGKAAFQLNFSMRYLFSALKDEEDGKFKAKNKKKLQEKELKKMAPQLRSKYLAVSNLINITFIGSPQNSHNCQ